MEGSNKNGVKEGPYVYYNRFHGTKSTGTYKNGKRIRD